MGKEEGPIFIVDNREDDDTDKVSGYLKDWCEISSQFDIATGYFGIGALTKLDGEWNKLDKLRILIGDQVDKPTYESLIKGVSDRLEEAFDNEKAKRGNDFLSGVPAIIEAIRERKIECKVYTEKKFHAKMYITHSRHRQSSPVALVGSSNFTVAGTTKNIELNVRIEDSGRVKQLQDWFEYFWNNAEDVSEDVLEVMERQAKEYSPFLVYGRSLEEYFRGRDSPGPAAWHEDSIEKGGSVMWKILDNYQQDGYEAMVDIGRKWGGAFLCDGVGLGKTFVGMMLIERLAKHEGKNVLLLAPKAILESVWKPELENYLGSLTGWATNLHVQAITDLTRKKSTVDGLTVDFEKEWGMARDRFDAVIIDEGHHFRNRRDNKKYQILFDLVNKGREKELYFLTATPINNSVNDLKHMIDLFTGGDTGHFSRVGVGNYHGHITSLKKKIKAIAGKSAVDDVDESLMSDKEVVHEFKGDPLVRKLVVQRSRKFVQESQKINIGRDIIFPEPQDPQVWEYDLESVYGDLLDDFVEAFSAREDEELFKLSLYYPYDYYREDVEPPEDIDLLKGRLKQIVRLIRTGFLKSFESSIHSFEWRCNKMLLKVLSWLKEHRIDSESEARYNEWLVSNKEVYDHALRFTKKQNSSNDEDEEEDLDETLPDVEKNKWSNEEFHVSRIIDDSYTDLELLAGFSGKLKKLNVEDDAKLNSLTELLLKVFNESPTGKVIIFTEFTKTAQYLNKQLSGRIPNHVVTEVHGATKGNRRDIVQRFSPYYNKTTSAELVEAGEQEIDVLVSTDVLAEGLNLQDATKLINYDIHWNPVKLMQRIGRIDRRMNNKTEEIILSHHPERKEERLPNVKIDYWNFLPPRQLDRILGLYNRVSTKYLSISLVFGIEGGKGLTEDDKYQDLREFNADRLGLTTTDEAMKLQLEALLKEHPELVEAWRRMPYHTISGKQNSEGRKGVFLCFRIPERIKQTDEQVASGKSPLWSVSGGYGECRWFFYDIETEEILDQESGGQESISEQYGIIACSPETPRVVSSGNELAGLKDIQKKVRKRIKNSVMRNLQAPVGVKPRLLFWMEVS